MADRDFQRLCVTLVALLLNSGVAIACAICFSNKAVAPGQRIDAADVVVLAAQDNPSGSYRVTETIKGELAAGTIVSDVAAAQDVSVSAADPELLVRNRPSQQWMSLGAVGAGEAGWLRRFAAAGPPSDATRPTWPPNILTTSDMSEEAWAKRLAMVAPRLESPDCLSAAIAYGELARAPYRAMRRLTGARQPHEVAGWLDNASLVSRHSAYILLFGIVGGGSERDYFRTRLRDLARSHDQTDLAALIAADLELGGPSRLSWIEETYLEDSRRSLAEIEAVLLALGVQGAADAAIPRTHIVAAYRRFIRGHPAMAGFVAPDLSNWQDYSAAADMEAAIRSGAIKDPGSQFAVLSYLKRTATPHQAPLSEAGRDLPL